jgi:hypothetical protein
MSFINHVTEFTGLGDWPDENSEKSIFKPELPKVQPEGVKNLRTGQRFGDFTELTGQAVSKLVDGTANRLVLLP